MPAGYRARAGLSRALASGLLLASAACSGGAGTAPQAAGPVSPAAARGTAGSGAATASPAQVVPPASVHADELGAVPVLMYHQLEVHPKREYDQTAQQFRTELTALYAHGYRTVTAGALVTGAVDIPAGRHPMVLTFDDSTVSQFGELADGSVDPASGVGILLQVAAAAGEQHPVATFYVNGGPFAGKDVYLAALHGLGMEVAEHTLTHANLRQLSDAGVQSELAQGLQVITRAVPGVQVTTMALPFGVRPKNHLLAARGRAGGTSYDFAGVFAVGSNPAPSPYSTRFDPTYVPRIRSGLRTGDQTFTSTYWLPRLFSGAVTAFTSDGDPSRISFPKAEAARLAPRFASRAQPY